MTPALTAELARVDDAAAAGEPGEAARIAAGLRARYGGELRAALAREGLVAPHLLLVGPPRTGTTWLKQTLGDHPAIRMARGEPNVLNAAGRGGLLAALRWYDRPDVWRASGGGHLSIVAEKSPGYIRLPDDTIAVLAALLPDLRIVAGRRDEAERLWSALHHRMRVLGFGFGGDWRLFVRRHADEAVHQVDAGRLDSHLVRWRHQIGGGSVLVIDFHCIGARPAETLSSVLEFAGVRSLGKVCASASERLGRRLATNPNPGAAGPPPPGFLSAVAEELAGLT